jgi:hypothetical protein
MEEEEPSLQDHLATWKCRRVRLVKLLQVRGLIFVERIYDVASTHTLSMREYVLIHIIPSLHLYNDVIHTHT